jgi:tRNA(Arg) A34 adenosine deaminase TadA
VSDIVQASSHEDYMRLAIAQAVRGRETGEHPFGAILMEARGAVVASAYDTVERDDDRSSHPETMLVKACHELGRDLSGCTLYTTTEPCAMCFTTAWLAGVSQIVFGTTMDVVRRHTSGIVEWVFVPAEWLNARTCKIAYRERRRDGAAVPHEGETASPFAYSPQRGGACIVSSGYPTAASSAVTPVSAAGGSCTRLLAMPGATTRSFCSVCSGAGVTSPGRLRPGQPGGIECASVACSWRQDSMLCLVAMRARATRPCIH